jgi:hypothetical protein
VDINHRSILRGATGAAALAAFGIAEGAAGTAFAASSSSTKYSLEFDSAA